jgi:hypothetical protein
MAESLDRLVGQLGLEPAQEELMRGRWLDQIGWLERKAASAQRSYYALRVTTVVGAVLVPALVSLTTLDGRAGTAAKVAAWVIGVVVAVSAALEQLYRFGERWRDYRRTAELLKAEGWLFAQHADPYQAGPAATYPAFAARVEEILGSDLASYLARTADRRGS